MGCCNDFSTALAPAAPEDPSLRVNYAKGMVLGVDDYAQEHAYLAARDERILRECLGYGTIAGLAVSVEPSPQGPRLRVARGSAAAPSGKLICVRADQCGLIDKWLAKPENAKKLEGLGGASPPAAISLYLTLCFNECETAPAPIPGEPCRSEDDLMAFSRVADDYRLDLRLEAPRQSEHDAARDFVRWLKGALVHAGSPPPSADEAAWLAALSVAVEPWTDALAASPPSSPPPSFATLGDYLFDSPPVAFSVAPDDLWRFLHVAFRFWATRLRPLWAARMCGAAATAEDDCVLLARIDAPIKNVGAGAAAVFEVDGDVIIDESARPILAHAQLLQEWLLCGSEAMAPPPAAAAASRLAVTETSASELSLDATHQAVFCVAAQAQTIRLPRCGPTNEGRVYVVKNTTGPGKTLRCDAQDTIDENGATRTLAAGAAVTVVSNGKHVWRVIATTA